jgi:hypothetical protein
MPLCRRKTLVNLSQARPLLSTDKSLASSFHPAVYHIPQFSDKNSRKKTTIEKVEEESKQKKSFSFKINIY